MAADMIPVAVGAEHKIKIAGAQPQLRQRRDDATIHPGGVDSGVDKRNSLPVADQRHPRRRPAGWSEENVTAGNDRFKLIFQNILLVQVDKKALAIYNIIASDLIQVKTGDFR